MLKTRIVVRRKQWTTYGYGAECGSGHCKDHFDRQYLTKEWVLFGVCIWRKILDYEDVPVWAWAEMGTCGLTSWKSKFHKEIDDAKRTT